MKLAKRLKRAKHETRSMKREACNISLPLIKKAMKKKIFFLLKAGLLFCIPAIAQQKAIQVTKENSTVYNRGVKIEKDIVHLNAADGNGLLWINNSGFKNGIIELDVKGKNAQGQSFVGIAFHGKDDSNYDAVYFRPFNFKNPERNSHSVQYISMPDNDWQYLRTTFPGKYENKVNPVPDPDDWFHMKVVMNYPEVKVFVNDAAQPSLVVNQISKHQEGKIGFWVGNGSEGWFRNLSVEE